MITGFDELHGEVELHDRGQKGSELRQPVTSRFHVQVVVGVFVHNCFRQTSAPYVQLSYCPPKVFPKLSRTNNVIKMYFT